MVFLNFDFYMVHVIGLIFITRSFMDLKIFGEAVHRLHQTAKGVVGPPKKSRSEPAVWLSLWKESGSHGQEPDYYRNINSRLVM